MIHYCPKPALTLFSVGRRFYGGNKNYDFGPRTGPLGLPMGRSLGRPMGRANGSAHGPGPGPGRARAGPRQNMILKLMTSTKKTRSARTIRLPVVSRRDLCYASENEDFVSDLASVQPPTDHPSDFPSLPAFQTSNCISRCFERSVSAFNYPPRLFYCFFYSEL